MPAAWFIGYWQRRTSDTSGQLWIISGGLLVSTLGFGNNILIYNPFLLINFIASSLDLTHRICFCRHPNFVLSYRRHRFRNALSCTLPGFYKSLETKRARDRDKRILPRSIHWGDRWSGTLGKIHVCSSLIPPYRLLRVLSSTLGLLTVCHLTSRHKIQVHRSTTVSSGPFSH